MTSSREVVLLFACLGVASACELASEEASEQDEALQSVSSTSEPSKAAGLLSAQVGLVTPATSLDAQSFRAVAAASSPGCDLRSVSWSEDDAKLLLALVLQSMCSVVAGCESWLWDALELGPQGSVMLSAASGARLAAEAKALRSAGQERRALLVEEWETNAASDLESVSSIGLSTAAVQEVLAHLTGPAPAPTSTPQINRLSDLGVSAASALTPDASRAIAGVLTASSLSTNAAIPLDRASSSATTASAAERSDGGAAYVRELHARARERSAAALAAACPGASRSPATQHDKALPRLGAVECAPGGGALDTALDMSCENVLPGKTYCANYDPAHEWATGSSPHQMNVAFAVSARRCEPCQDGYGVGTLRLIKNTKNQALTMCDTSASCNPSSNPQVPACTCMN